MDLLFPHDKPREFQREFIEKVQKAIETKTHLIVHAPTGSGKTAASLSPALTYARAHPKKGLSIFFLTSRHTQHSIVLETLHKIKEKYDLNLMAAPIIGKKHMCAQSGVEFMRSDEFREYCKSLREEGRCEYYENARSNGKPTVKAKQALDDLRMRSPVSSEQTISHCAGCKLCPYEVSLEMAKQADVIVCDYNYVFNQSVSDHFFAKIDKHLDSSVVIVDEGHNLPSRIRESLTARLTSNVLSRAVSEAKKYQLEEVEQLLRKLHSAIEDIAENVPEDGERLVKKEELEDRIEETVPVDEMITQFQLAATSVREHQKTSSIGSIAAFLESWEQAYLGQSRIISTKKGNSGRFIILSNRCMDPSAMSKKVIEQSHSTILMSGTLTPTGMYKDLLGFPKECVEEELPSPFPEKNKLTLIIPKTSTKYRARTPEMYSRIADICARIVDEVRGCSAIFFPSYYLRDQVHARLETRVAKTLFLEQPGLSKEEKQQLIDKFKSYKQRGAVLLGVAAGSFGEGVDLPGVLKCVIVVGLPLDRPSLQTKELIGYYDRKFGKGWDYGYILPAITKTLQNAGRCIRTEDDKGVLVFLDERYAWPQYIRCFPNDWNLKISLDYLEKIRSFFGPRGQTRLQVPE